MWIPYVADVADKLEAAKSQGKQRCDVDGTRWVDLETSTQRVKVCVFPFLRLSLWFIVWSTQGDAKKRRAVMRTDVPLVDMTRATKSIAPSTLTIKVRFGSFFTDILINCPRCKGCVQGCS